MAGLDRIYLRSSCLILFIAVYSRMSFAVLALPNSKGLLVSIELPTDKSILALNL